MSTFTKWEVFAITPKAGENLITNPSIEAATTGYTAVNSALAVSSTYARYGTNSLRVTPSDASAAGAYWSAALTDTLTYTFSLSIKGEAGKTYTMAFVDDTGAAVEASLQFTANGYWQRKSVTFTANETDTFYLQLLRDAGQSTTAAFYTDGWQLEASATMTTYIDGTLDSVVGMLRGRTEYYWTGTQHASTSKRVEWTASGGELVKLSDYCRILSVVGLGLPQISPIAADVSTGGGIYQWSRAGNRDFQLVVSFSGANPGEVAKDIAAVQEAVDITSARYNQPLRLMMVGYDAGGVIEQSETLWVDCAYTGGLEGSFSNYHYENRVINFRNYSPVLRGEGYKTSVVAHQTVFSGACVIREQPDGTCDNWGVTEAATTDAGHVIAKSTTGIYYLGGNFTNLNAIAEADYIAQNSGGIWAACASGLNGQVRAMTIGPDDTLYVAGDFTDAGGDAAADYIAKWNGSAFSAVGAGGASHAIYALAISSAGHLYAGGEFTDIGGSGADYLARFDGTNWNTVVSATGLNGRVNCIIPDPWGDGVIIGGAFTDAGAATVDYLARVTITGTTYAYALIGSAAPNAAVTSLHYDASNGRLYAAGEFTSIGGVAVGYVAYYDGTKWVPMGSGFGDAWNTTQAAIASGKGAVHFAGGIGSAGGVALPDGFASWTGNQWKGQWFVNDLTAGARGVYVDQDTSNVFWLCAISSGKTPGFTSVDNTGYSNTYPVLVVNGLMTYFCGIRNYTTGEDIKFSNLTIKANERLVIVFGQNGVTSARIYANGAADTTTPAGGQSYRDCMQYILPGSSSTITLIPGNNNIGAFAYSFIGVSAAAYISYPLTYRSIEGAII